MPDWRATRWSRTTEKLGRVGRVKSPHSSEGRLGIGRVSLTAAPRRWPGGLGHARPADRVRTFPCAAPGHASSTASSVRQVGIPVLQSSERLAKEFPFRKALESLDLPLDGIIAAGIRQVRFGLQHALVGRGKLAC